MSFSYVCNVLMCIVISVIVLITIPLVVLLSVMTSLLCHSKFSK